MIADPITVHAASALPDERLPVTARPLSIAISFVLPVLLVLGMNFALALALEARPQNRGYWLLSAKWDLLAAQNEPVDTLVLGDSTCNQGVIPEVLQRHLGGRVLNLCTLGDALAVSDAWMAGAYLERVGAPKRIVVMHAYDTWHRDSRLLRAMAWTFGEHRELFLSREPRLDFTTEERVLLSIGKWVPFYTQTTTARALLAEPEALRDRRNYELDPGGFMPVRRTNAVQLMRETHLHRRAHESQAFKLSEENQRGLRELIRLSDLYGVPLYVSHSPMFAGTWNSRTVRRNHNAVSDELEGLLEEGKNAVLLQREPVRYDALQVESIDHVTVSAARDLTERLAQSLREIESGTKSQKNE